MILGVNNVDIGYNRNITYRGNQPMTTTRRGIARIIKSNLTNATVFAILFIFDDGSIEFKGSYQTKELAVFNRKRLIAEHWGATLV